MVLTAGCSPDDERPVIKAAVLTSMAPFAFEEDGRVVGLEMEIIEGYCASRDCRVEVLPVTNWQHFIGAVANGNADVAFSGISITAERRALMDFSQPYMLASWSLLSLPDRALPFADLLQWKHYTTGFPRGMAFREFIEKVMEPAGIYANDLTRTYPSYEETLADLRAGHIDLLMIDSALASTLRKQVPLHESYVFEGMDEIAFAFPKESSLRADFDRYLDELGRETLHAIITSWMN